MKIIFERSSLAGGLALIHNMISAASTMPILGHLLIEAGEESATLSATDLESFGRVQLKVQVEEGGRVTAPARLLADIVRVLPDGDVTLESSGSRLTVSANRNSYQLATLPPEEFPEWPRVAAEMTLTLLQADLKRILHNTMFAIPTRDPRKVLMGVLFDVADGRLICVATDGRKLGKTSVTPVEIKGKSTSQVIIPEHILNEIDRAIGEDGEVEVGLGERQIMFKLPNLTYITNRIDGAYPKYEAVIPQSFKRTIRIQKGTLADAIIRAGILAERQHHSIILQFQPRQVEITAASSEDGTYEGTVETDYEGEPFRIAFNHHYLEEIFKVTPDTVLNMKIKEATAPDVFECESDPEALFLVMPVRIADLEPERAETAD